MTTKRRKPTVESSLRQLQKAFITTGKAVRQLQRRLDRLERKDRVITGFADGVGGMAESDEDEE